MQHVSSIAEARRILDEKRCAGQQVGLVPTMGFLHDGHASLMQASVADCDFTMVTIFVNPLQFAAGEDLDDYPRDLEGDLKLCESHGVDLVLIPTVEEMYPLWPTVTTVIVDELTTSMEGAERPTHFAGVATVVTKLFAIAGPCRAYFGEKDYQQLAMVKRMVIDLSIPVEVIGRPIVREDNGLARSSRNTYLSDEQRKAASVLYRSLMNAVASIEAGERSPVAIRNQINSEFDAEELVQRPDYVAVVDADTLKDLDELVSGQNVRIILAAQCGTPRLLDNIGVVVP